MRASTFMCLIALAAPGASALAIRSRRTVVAGLLAGTLAPAAHAEEAAGPVVLTEEQMAARVALKQELLRKKAGGPAFVSATDVRSDINPEAGANLRARSLEENMRGAIEKQNELKTRGTKQKRDDMCEMLGRGC